MLLRMRTRTRKRNEDEEEDEEEEAVHKTVVIRELNHDGSEKANTDVRPSVLSALVVARFPAEALCLVCMGWQRRGEHQGCPTGMQAKPASEQQCGH